MHKDYSGFSSARLNGEFGEMSSWRFVIPFLKDKRVLDIGCADGLYLQQMDEGSVGIEQLQDLAAAGKKRGLDIRNGDVLDVISRLEKDSFGGVLFSHVMEHVD